MKLSQITVRPVHRAEEFQFQKLMQSYHHLGALPKIGNTIWYVATNNEEWVSLISYSSAALKCGARDHWIAWGFRHQYDRLHLIANNSRFLILPQHHYKKRTLFQRTGDASIAPRGHCPTTTRVSTARFQPFK